MMKIGPEEYIRRIKAQQNFILAAIGNIEDKAPQHSRISNKEYNSLKSYIKIFQNEVLAYFEWQRSPFWDVIAKMYSLDSESLKVIEFLKVSLRNVKVMTYDFLESHPADMGDQNSKEFHADFIAFSKAIEVFLNEEDRYLIPLLENLQIM